MAANRHVGLEVLGKRILIVGLMLASAGAGCSKESSPSPTTPSVTPSPTSKLGTTEANVTYCTAGGTALTLDVYYPTQALTPRYPAVVYIHGGQLIAGNKSAAPGSAADMWRATLTPRGYLFVSINYRLGPANKFPAMIEDSKCAIRYLRANAATYDLDPDRIGVTGTSSGGYLAALVALAGPGAGLEGNGGYAGVSSAVRAAVIEFGADMDLRQPTFSAPELEGRTLAFPQPLPADLIFSGTVVNHVSAGDPPLYIFHGERDSLVDPQDSRDLHNTLLAAGVASTFQLVTNAGHGWGTVTPFGPISPSWDQILQTELAFFDTHLKN